MGRVPAIDLLRGLIMILMAIDHSSAQIARVHFMEFWGQPFTAYPSIGWWATRFVSHLCAPGFFFLMGMSMQLSHQKKQAAKQQHSRTLVYFLKRAALILLLMFLVEFPGWGLGALIRAADFTGTGSSFPGQYDGGFIIPTTVLYGLASCMLIASLLLKAKNIVYLLICILSFGLSAFVINNLSVDQNFNPLAVAFIIPGLSNGMMAIYPIIPWLGVTVFGMLWGKLLLQNPDKIYNWSLITGILLLLVFFTIRFLGAGNFQLNSYHDLISFFTLIKYPPGVAFITCTMGMNLLLFGLLNQIKELRVFNVLLLFGKTAMFFYLLHLYVYALIGILTPSGCPLYQMYILWFIGLIPMYFLCKLFHDFQKKMAPDSIIRMI